MPQGIGVRPDDHNMPCRGPLGDFGDHHVTRTYDLVLHLAVRVSRGQASNHRPDAGRAVQGQVLRQPRHLGLHAVETIQDRGHEADAVHSDARALLSGAVGCIRPRRQHAPQPGLYCVSKLGWYGGIARPIPPNRISLFHPWHASSVFKQPGKTEISSPSQSAGGLLVSERVPPE